MGTKLELDTVCTGGAAGAWVGFFSDVTVERRRREEGWSLKICWVRVIGRREPREESMVGSLRCGFDVFDRVE